LPVFLSYISEDLLFLPQLDIVQQEYIHESGLEQFEVVKAAGAVIFFTLKWSRLLKYLSCLNRTFVVMFLLFLISIHTSLTGSFVLNTTISAPHEARITAISFDQAASSRTTMLLSCSRDGHFKAWQLALPAHTDGENPARLGFLNVLDQFLVFSRSGWVCFQTKTIKTVELIPSRPTKTLHKVIWSHCLLTRTKSSDPCRRLAAGRQLPGGGDRLEPELLGAPGNPVAAAGRHQDVWFQSIQVQMEWSTSTDVSVLLADPLSENMAAFCLQDRSTDCTSNAWFYFFMAGCSLNLELASTDVVQLCRSSCLTDLCRRLDHKTNM
ncbi:hypothetical protein XENOCAPTIV_027484, partial [Xenoophorus captivus]